MSLKKHYLIKLEKSPEHNQLLVNSWADYIELVCLANIDNEVSEEDIIDRLAGRVKDLKEDADESLAEMEDLEKESVDDIEPSRRAEVSDKWETRVKDYFLVLSLRQTLYKENYPFEVTHNIIKRKVVLDEKQFLYIYLLFCSNLYLFDDVTQGQLADSFELISFNAFQSLLPNDAIAHLFGKNQYNKRGRYSAGTFWKKLNKLKEDLCEELSPHVRQRDFSEYNTGDGGLDLVGWLPTGDCLPSSMIHFAQCACTYNFEEKQHSSSHAEWAQKIIFKNPPSNTIFIPHCFRRADGTWIKSTAIKFTFLIDRKRLLTYYLDRNKIKFSKLPVFRIVQRMITVKEGVI